MSLVGLQSFNMAPTDNLNLKHENSPHSVSTISSPAGLNNFSPPTQTSTIGNNNGGYVANVSPTEGSTASGYYNNGSMNVPAHPAATTSALTSSTSSDMPILNKEEDEFSMIQPMMLHPPCIPGTSSFTISPSKMPPTTAIPHMMPPNGFHNSFANVSSPTLVVRNPFDDDEPIRSPHSAPPIPQPIQHLKEYDQMRMFCPDMCIQGVPIKPIDMMKQGRRIPYAWNTERLPMPYPGIRDPRMELNRSCPYPSFAYPPMMNPMMHPRFPGMFPAGMPCQPPPQPPQAPPPAKKSKKDSRAAKAAAANAAAAAAAAAANTPNFASPEPMRPPSSTSMPPPDVFRVPNLKSPQEKRLQTPPNPGNPKRSISAK
jgi:hypothetical protein